MRWRVIQSCSFTLVVLCVLAVASALYHNSHRIFETWQSMDFAPLVSASTLLTELKSADDRRQLWAIHQMGRHGQRGLVFVPELRSVFMRNMTSPNWDDEILYKTLLRTLEQIQGSQLVAHNTLEGWKEEWITSHADLANERGLHTEVREEEKR